MNYREILIEKGLPLSFTATSQEEEISEYSGNNAWNYNGTNGNIPTKRSKKRSSVFPCRKNRLPTQNMIFSIF